MSERDQVAHLLRRLGLGAGKFEVDTYAPLGVQGTIDKLLNYDKVDEEFEVEPYEYTVYDAGLMLDPPKFASWWALRMLMTKRPLQEKMTLFWHDHFAVSAAKVFDGPSMLRYLETLRSHATGNFLEMAQAIAKDPAMMFYLDTQTNAADHPNENFARELLELFTMGSGYSEADVKEAARSLTGWALFYVGIGEDRPFDKLQEEAARKKQSVICFCQVPDRHDSNSKTFLGKSGSFSGEQVVEMAVKRPETTKYVTAKLATWLIGKAPSAKLNEDLAKQFQTNYEIKPIIKAIVASDEFWKSERNLPKSPVDFTVATFRQIDITPVLRSMRPKDKDIWKPIRTEMRGASDGLLFLMNQQGMLLLYPPDVAGWNWGEKWINSNNMTTRIAMAQTLFIGEDKNRPISSWVVNKISTVFKPTDSKALVNAYLEIFDGDHIPENAKRTMVALAEKKGGVKALADKESGAQLMAELGKAMFAVPEFQLC